MADITMCDGHGCIDREKCYRYTAPRSEYYQSIFVATPINDGKCELFLDNHDKPTGKQVSTPHKL